MTDTTQMLHESWAVYGYLYCEECNERVELSSADTFEEARDIAIDHHKENHD